MYERGGESGASLGLFLCAQDKADGIAQALPIDDLSVHVPTALFGQRVELSLPAGFGFFPFSLQPAFVFHPMERRIERALMDLEEFFRYLLKSLRDGVTVAGAQGDNLEDQHIESATEEFLFAFIHVDT
jgi:hypothetical protein